PLRAERKARRMLVSASSHTPGIAEPRTRPRVSRATSACSPLPCAMVSCSGVRASDRRGSRKCWRACCASRRATTSSRCSSLRGMMVISLIAVLLTCLWLNLDLCHLLPGGLTAGEHPADGAERQAGKRDAAHDEDPGAIGKKRGDERIKQRDNEGRPTQQGTH